jgi:NADH-quinone oxidoreductase subunit J
MSPSLLTAEGLSGLLFLGFIAITLLGALIATHAERLIRSVAGLALCFLGVAGLYYYLGSPFVALMQLLIYVGAVCVTIIFAIMLAENAGSAKAATGKTFAAIFAVLCPGVLLAALVELAMKTDWSPVARATTAGGQAPAGSVADIGISLLTTNAVSFELISVVLLAAIVGSLVLARSGRTKS